MKEPLTLLSDMAIRLSASMRAAGMCPEHTDTLATITVPRLTFRHATSDARLRMMNPREFIQDDSEMFIQVHNGYRVCIKAEADKE